MKGPLLNLFGFFAFLKTFFSPKSEIFTPKRDDEHPRPFHMGILHPQLPEKKSSSYSRLHSYKSYKTEVGATRNYRFVVAGDFPEVLTVLQINSTRLSQTFRARDFYQ